MACAQDPTTTSDSKLELSCFGDFGGTINPFMVLGGYPNSTYANATALVITIVIENSNDPQKIADGKSMRCDFDKDNPEITLRF